MKTWDKKRTHLVPVLIMDYVDQLSAVGNTPETRENIAQRLEAIRDYCSIVLEAHYAARKKAFLKK